MNISRFFIDRPIFAAVIAVFITLVGIFAVRMSSRLREGEIPVFVGCGDRGGSR